MSVTMKKLMSFNHDSTLLGQAPELGHRREPDCIHGLEVELNLTSKAGFGGTVKIK